MSPACPLGVEQQRHCLARQLGNKRYLGRGNKPGKELNNLFLTCSKCPHFLSDTEYNQQNYVAVVKDREVKKSPIAGCALRVERRAYPFVDPYGAGILTPEKEVKRRGFKLKVPIP